MVTAHPAETVASALALRAQGRSYADISRETGVPISSVYRWVAEQAPELQASEVKTARSAIAARATDLLDPLLDRVADEAAGASLYEAVGALKLLSAIGTEYHFGPASSGPTVQVDARQQAVVSLDGATASELRELLETARASQSAAAAAGDSVGDPRPARLTPSETSFDLEEDVEDDE